MKVLFKQAVHLDGKTYSRGVHEVPEKALKQKHFHKLLKAGWVSDPDAPPVEAISEQERVNRLAEKVLAKANQAKPVAPSATPNAVPKTAEPTPPAVEPEDEAVEPVSDDENDGLDELDGADESSEDNGEEPTPAEEEDAPEAPALEPADYSGKGKGKNKKKK